MRLVPLLAAATTMIFSALPALAQQKTPFPLYKAFNNWLLTCDNGGHCEANGSTAGYERPGATLRIVREAGATGKLTLSLESGEIFTNGQKPFSLKKLKLDSKPLSLTGKGWAWNADDSSYELKDPVNGKRFIDTIKDGSFLSFAKDQDISLSGLKAALLAMDDAQGRVGTVTAFIRPGKEPASKVPEAPPLPRVPHTPPVTPLSKETEQKIITSIRSVQTTALADNECDADERTHSDEAYALTDKQTIVVVDCYMAAYQSRFLIFVADTKNPAKAELLNLPYPQANGDKLAVEPPGVLIDADYSPEDKTISFSERESSGGLCGSSGTWTFDGKSFRLTNYSHRYDLCEGWQRGDWPTLIRSIRNDH